MHSEGMVHCDLKLDNVLINDDCNPELIDFELVLQSTKLQVKHMDVRGTPGYMPPEMNILDRLECDSVIDITKFDTFALGVMLF